MNSVSRSGPARARAETTVLVVAELEAHAVAVAVAPRPRSRARTEATARARSRPAGRRRRRACPAGSRARCRRGRRRAGSRGRRGRRAARGARRGRRSAPRRARPSRPRGAAARRRRSSSSSDGLVAGQRDRAAVRARPPSKRTRELDAVGERLGDARRDDALGQLELLGGDDALGELDELVVRPRRRRTTTPSPRISRRPSRRTWTANGCCAISTRSAPRSSTRAPATVAVVTGIAASFAVAPATPLRHVRFTRTITRTDPARSRKRRFAAQSAAQTMRDKHKGATMTPRSTSRVDLHCHSTASAVSKLGVQRALGLPECATPPEEVYELAKRRGMDFVTITDHDTIDGALELAATLRRRVRLRGADRLVSRRAAGRPHPLLGHHARRPRAPAGARRRRRGRRRRAARALDRLRARAPVLRRRGAAAAAPPPPPRAAVRDLGDAQRLARPRAQRARRRLHRDARRHRRRRLRRPRRRRHRPHVHRDAAPRDAGATFLDHVVLGNATRARRAGQRREVDARRDGRSRPARSAAARATAPRPTPQAVFDDGPAAHARGRRAHAARSARGLGPDDARALLRAWLASVELDLDEAELLALLQARGLQPRRPLPSRPALPRAQARHARSTQIAAAAPGGADIAAAATTLFDACLAAIPYAPAAAFLGREKAKLAHRDGEPLRVALVADAVGGMHGVTHTLDELRERGVPGFEVEVVGTDRNVDRRLSAVAEIDIPFYAGPEGRRAEPAGDRRGARRRAATTSSTSARPGPSGAAAGDHRPRHGRAGARQLPHRARRLRRACARRTRGSRSPRGSRSAPSTGSAGACCRRARRPTRCCARWASPTSASGAGTAASTSRRFSPAAPRRGPAAGRDHRALRGPPDPREGRRPARRRVPRGARARPAPAPRARRRRARGGRAARAPRRARDVPRLARGRRARARLRERRHLPLRQPHGHVRPGPARGAGERAAGRRRRRRRADEHRHRRRHRAPVPGRRGRPGRRGVRARGAAAAARAPRAHRAATRCAQRTWERSLQRLADGYRRALDPVDAGRGRRAVPRESSVLEARRRLRGRRRGAARCARVAAPPLRVADVALFYGERSGGIRTYLDAKAAWAQATRADRAPRDRARARARAPRRRPPRAAVAAPGGDERLPRCRSAPARCGRRCARCAPTSSLLHDPFWAPAAASRARRTSSARRSSRCTTARSRSTPPACRGPTALWHRVLRAWMHHAYRDADAVMSAVDPRADCGRAAAIALRFGLDPAFVPQPDVRARGPRPLRRAARAREGRRRAAARGRALARAVAAAAASGAGRSSSACGAWPSGSGSRERVQWRPYIADRARLARCVRGRARRRHARRARDVRPRRLRGGGERRVAS